MKDAAIVSPQPRVNPQSIDLAILDVDLMARRGLERDVTTLKNCDALKRWICKKPHGKAYFGRLRDAGCDPNLVLWYLSAVRQTHVSRDLQGWFDEPGPGSLVGLTGLHLRQFASLKKLLAEAANRIEDINYHSQFGRLLHTGPLQFLSAIPALLREYVSLLKLAAKRFGHGTHVYHNFAKAALIAHVNERTGRQFDKEVSGLIGIVTNNPKYGEGTHGDWRRARANLKLIISIAPKYSGGRRRRECKH